MTTLDDCTIIQLPKMASTKGNLTPVHALEHVPFEIERVYYIYDVPGGESRGAHAHKELQQFFVALMGGFEVVLDDGSNRQKFLLNRAYYGLYVPRLIWRELINFSSGGICLVMASLPYDPSDYIRDYEEFLGIKQRDRSRQ
jgi:hypothetical protein